jgi:hypothetical protein
MEEEILGGSPDAAALGDEKVEETRACSNKDHACRCKVYPKNKVPRNQFIRIGGVGPDYKTCANCRSFDKNLRNGYRKKRKAESFLVKEPILITSEDRKDFEPEEVGICAERDHSYYSKYPKDKVPCRMFVRERPGLLFKSCKDCRLHAMTLRKLATERKKTMPCPDGMFLCASCKKICPQTEIGKSKQEENTKSCSSCISKKRAREQSRRVHLHELKIARILRTGYSCAELREIHLKSELNPNRIQRLKVVDGGVTYNGKEYDHREFVRINQEKLECSHLEWDHIPKDEWDETRRGMPWSKKYDTVRNIENKQGRIQEAAKCALVSGLGHIIVTEKRREQARDQLGDKWRDRATYLMRAKEESIATYKRSKQCICEECGESYMEAPLAFMELDHMDIYEKIDSISTMMYEKEVTVEQIEAELKKCRLLCKYCHTRHTNEQLKDGIIQKKRHETIKKRKLDSAPE